jgi:hypothetical protein
MIRAFLFLWILSSTLPLLAKGGTENSSSPASEENSSSFQRPVRDLINQLPPSELQEALGQLRSNYVDPNALKNPEIDETAIESLVARLGPGAGIQAKEEAEKPVHDRPFKTELIFSHFGYIRLGELNFENLSQLDGTLNDFRTHDCAGLILDMRTMPPNSDYSLAAAIVSRFAPKGQPIFKLWQRKDNQEKWFTSSADPIYSGPIAILVNSANAGASETIAGTLRSKVHALVIGQKTSGRAVEYKQYPVGKRLLLSVAVGQIQIPGEPSIFPNGLIPDITVTFPNPQQDNVLALGDAQGVADLILDEERPHTNEAALVAGKSPDLDAFEAEQVPGKHDRVKPKDLVIQHALDFLITTSIYRGN